jgi:hypothetical protein
MDTATALSPDWSTAMWTLIAIPLTCWVCAFLTRPRNPRLSHEVEDRVYARLLGRQHWLILVATLVTVGALLALVLALPGAGDGAPEARHPVACGVLVAGMTTCAVPEAGGGWIVLERGRDGTWRQVKSIPASLTAVPPVGD